MAEETLKFIRDGQMSKQMDGQIDGSMAGLEISFFPRFSFTTSWGFIGFRGFLEVFMRIIINIEKVKYAGLKRSFFKKDTIF